MKIIKSIATLIVCVFATALLNAQQLKAEVPKPIETNIPAGANNQSVAQSGLTPQPQVDVIALKAPAVAIEAPSPIKRDKDSKPVQNMSAEQAKILAGKTERPKPIASVPATTVVPAAAAAKAE